MKSHQRRKARRVLLGAAINSPQDYSQLQYSIPFQTDDSYESWSPTRPQAYYADPRYQHGLIPSGSGPLFNSRLSDPDDFDDKFDRDFDDRFDGLNLPLKRKLKRLIRAR